MLFRFSLYGFLKNQRYFEPFFMLALMSQGLSFFMIGVLYAFRSLTINLLEIPSGALADGYGRRSTMLGSLVAYVLSFAVFALAPNLAFLFIAMFLYGIGDAMRTGTHKSMIFEWLKLRGEEEDRTRVYGFTRSWSKFGSAVSAMIAAILVIVTDDYRSVFLFATLPYICNIINLIGYPAELDGLVYRKSLGESLATLGQRMRGAIKSAWKRPNLRGLFAEAMAWEGVFNAMKDYVQPAVVLLITAKLIGIDAAGSAVEPGQVAGAGVNRGAVIAVAAVYTLLFFASGIASRQAHRLVARSGSPRAASKLLWQVNLGLFVGLFLSDLIGLEVFVVAAFVLLAIAQNLWRPVLISRLDKQTEANRGATILSLESQAQRLTTMVIGPLGGWLVDLVSRRSLPGNFWPLALIGGLAAGAILWTRYRKLELRRPNTKTEELADAQAT